MELCIFVVLVTVGYFWKAKVSLVCYIYATFLAFIFFSWEKIEQNFFWFVRSTLLCSPRHSVFSSFCTPPHFTLSIIFESRILTVLYAWVSLHSKHKLHYLIITWFKLSYRGKSKRKYVKGVVSKFERKLRYQGILLNVSLECKIYLFIFIADCSVKYSSVLQFFFR